MRTLADILLADHQREALTVACVAAVERHLNGLRSLRGMALKTGLALFRKAVPDAVPRIVRKLLPDVVAALEPLHQQFRASSSRDFSLFLRQHSAQASAALASVMDRRADASSNEIAKSAYARFRGSVHDELDSLMPELTKVLSGYLD